MNIKALFKILILLLLMALGIGSCTSNKKAVEVTSQEKKAFEQKEGDTITIANDSLEYDIIIIEPGYNVWLQSIAKPRQYYSQSFLENRNNIYVREWNARVMQPQRYSPNLYELQINYDFNINYGYEVNYQLYNYFIYFQRKYNQRLGPFVPRI
ncbi:DUF6146 family protein [Sediminicola arcticus]|jgi:hypothetical protein|uniref:DUF6146 family protein n=1 Tax=Sediminicola arcticus TaxID=1574308 RepID=A0ABV2STK7_9FLAO|tara:strand:- start:15 stop:476 length:462 start_codon:yes stop_codon:yes gene_type:complete